MRFFTPLRAKGLVHKVPQPRRYRLLPERYRLCIVFLRRFERPCAPREPYAEHPEARFGVLASSKDRDLVMHEGHWSNARARGYRRGAVVRDPFQLRLNAYRVLLTRGRDACVVFVPPMRVLDETCEYLVGGGFRTL